MINIYIFIYNIYIFLSIYIYNIYIYFSLYIEREIYIYISLYAVGKQKSAGESIPRAEVQALSAIRMCIK